MMMNMAVEGEREETLSFKQWEIENGVTLSNREPDYFYKYPPKIASQNKDDDGELYDKERKKKKVDSLRFKNACISAIALLKMVKHAHSGGSMEVMGLMLGYAQDDSIVVLDTFALPVEGTETRVDAGGEAQGYMVTYLEAVHRAGRQRENVVGWYHSHPGYGCWLSGIDVGTQRLHQSYEDPYLAVVIDPVRTAAAGKVEIGAFRTYPPGYVPDDDNDGDMPANNGVHVPQSKIGDYGVHYNEYYALNVKVFKSSLDCDLLRSLWRSYWASTLFSVPRAACGTAQQLVSIADRMKSMCVSVGSPDNDGEERVLSGKEVAKRILADQSDSSSPYSPSSSSSLSNSVANEASSAGQNALSEMATLCIKAKLFC